MKLIHQYNIQLFQKHFILVSNSHY